jgi:C-terminal processing protease CtpA/Prc
LVTSIKGAEILAIDGKPTKEIIKKTQSLYSSDGFNKTFYNQVLDKSFDAYYYISYGMIDSSKLTLKIADSTYNYVIKTIKPAKEEKKLVASQELGEKKITDKQDRKLKKKNRYKGVDNFGKPILDLKFDSILNSTAIMTIKSFDFKSANFNKFVRESFEELKQENIQHLVLDIRNNGGGRLMACNRLFRYLYNQPHKFTGRAYMSNSYLKNIKYEESSPAQKGIKIIIFPISVVVDLLSTHRDSIGVYGKLPTDHPKKSLKNNYTNDLLVLINGYSFSAASLFAANLQEVKRGFFIGEETGGGYNQCTAGTIPYINLPNTGLKLRLPLRVLQITDKRKIYGRGVFPKYEVKENFDDVLTKRDKYLEKARELIKVNGG